MPELPPNVSGEPVLSEHIKQAARSICPGAPASVPYEDLDVDARHTVVSTYVRDFHKWAMAEHRLHEYDPATGAATLAQNKFFFSIMDNSMTLAFRKNIKMLEKVFKEELAHDLTVTPQMQASARKDLECHTAGYPRGLSHDLHRQTHGPLL